MDDRIPELKCPLCNSTLTSSDYQQAIEELKKKVSETYGEEYRKCKEEYEQKLLKADQGNKKEVADLKATFEENKKMLHKEIEDSYKTQFGELKRTYEKITKDSQKQFSVLEKKIKDEGKKALQEKEKQLNVLIKEQARLKKLAFDEGKSKADVEIAGLRNDVKERDIQLGRFQRDIEDLKKQLQQSQAELKGEVGEIDLYTNLTQEFQQDFFIRQKRGTSMGDIIQQIRTGTKTLETPIIYDNKQAESVTSKDIEKAKRYKSVHSTDYVIIVSSHLPKKEVKNGLFGEKEGILLCHPCIVTDVAKQIRRAMIEISKQSESRKDREVKESKLYDYIKSQEFTGTLEKLHEIYQRMADLQDSEEKAHGRLWKERKKLQFEVNDTYVGISNSVDYIIQDSLPMQELANDQEEQNEQEKTLEKITPLLTKKKKEKQEVTH